MENNIEINKSSRHQKVIGNFGESIFCNWLSRSGFEVTIVDHTGIDIVAYNPIQGNRLGISVKSRTRNIGKEFGGIFKILREIVTHDILKILGKSKHPKIKSYIKVILRILYKSIKLLTLISITIIQTKNNFLLNRDFSSNSIETKRYKIKLIQKNTKRQLEIYETIKRIQEGVEYIYNIFGNQSLI
ncbi:MAG: hypothetical protein MUP85_06705 [Candidatus Lokiarchaeota archaeon]|nr:hypothetical protein [Candidatus Lokiarchaeota archaeon]